MEEIAVFDPPKGIRDSDYVRNTIISVRRNLGISSLRLAYLLKRVKDKKLYEDWGANSFEEAIADPDISISRSTAYGLLQVWDTWVEKYRLEPEKVAQIPYDKLLIVAPMVEDSNHLEMFENARVLSRADLFHMKLEKKLNKSMTYYKNLPNIYRCNSCGAWKIEAQPDELCSCHPGD
jgi:predicted nuclease of restriction endonuclease-like RecB superfamily